MSHSRGQMAAGARRVTPALNGAGARARFDSLFNNNHWAIAAQQVIQRSLVMAIDAGIPTTEARQPRVWRVRYGIDRRKG